MSSARKRALLVAACWVQLGAAAICLTIAIVADLTAPSLGFTWNRQNVITGVVPGSEASLAGVRAGNRLVELNRYPQGYEYPRLIGSVAGDVISVRITDGSRLLRLEVTTRTRLRERLDALGAGGAAAIESATTFLRLAANVLVLLLAATILRIRPQLGAARVAALTLAYWAGGNNFATIPGIGTMLPVDSAVAQAVYYLDLAFLSFFFALNLHFALIFPEPLRLMSRNKRLQLIPYIAALPLFATAAFNLARFLEPSLRSLPRMPAEVVFTTYGPLLLIITVAALAAHFPATRSLNERRRLQLVLLAGLPGIFSWMVWIVIAATTASASAIALAGACRWLGALIGAAIFSYALARHRLFDVRPLIRNTIQYALARGTLLVILALPGVTLLALLYTRRNESLRALISNDFAALVALSAAILLVVRDRQRILDSIDRRFFRHQYDARVTLVRLVSMVQRGNDFNTVARVALMEIDKALYPRQLSLWRRAGESECTRDLLESGSNTATLPVRCGQVMKALADRRGPLLIDFDDPSDELVHAISAEERTWLQGQRAALALPLMIEEELIGFILVGERRSEEPYSSGEIELLNAIAAQLALTERYTRLEALAKRDALTEALNRHAFYSLFEKRRFTAAPGPGCVAVVDLNDLKAINDTSGHKMGDAAIRRVASGIRSVVRADDLIFRWGGDEFLVVVFGLTEEEVESRFVTLNEMLRSDPELPLTVSIGLGSFAAPELLSQAIEFADQQMYARKQAFKSATA